MLQLGQKCTKRLPGIHDIFQHNYMAVDNIGVQSNCGDDVTRRFGALVGSELNKTDLRFNSDVLE